jgi:RND family efflux transporter MFP subunit
MNLTKILFIPAIVSVFFLIPACSGETSKKELNNDKPIFVEVSSNTMGASIDGLTFTGQVEAAHTANVATRIMGYITKIYVKVGDKVKAGQLLFAVNSTDIQAKQAQVDAMLKQAEAAFHVAQKDFDRYTTLYKQNSASAKELEQITMQYQSAKAGVEAAKGMQHEVKSQLTYANVVAPFSGVVTQKLADEGSLANPGMPILTVEQGGALQITATVPETEIAQVKLGEIANVQIDAANKHFKSKLIQISPSSQFTGGQYVVKLGIPSTEANTLMAGMYATINLTSNASVSKKNSDTTSVVMIPKKVLVYRDQLVGVYTVSAEKTALLRWLRLGKTVGDKVEVLSGLSAKENYIIKTEGNLYNGAKVTIK